MFSVEPAAKRQRTGHTFDSGFNINDLVAGSALNPQKYDTPTLTAVSHYTGGTLPEYHAVSEGVPMFMSLLDTNEAARLFSVAAMHKFADCTASALHQNRWMPGYMYQDIKTLFNNARYMATRWRLMGGVTTPVDSIDQSSFVCIQMQGHGMIRNIFGNVEPGMRVGIMAIDQCIDQTDVVVNDLLTEMRETNQDRTAMQTFRASKFYRVQLMPVVIPGAFATRDESCAQPQYHSTPKCAIRDDMDDAAADMCNPNAVLSIQNLTEQTFSSNDYIFPYSGIHSTSTIDSNGRVQVTVLNEVGNVTEMNNETRMTEWRREVLNADGQDVLAHNGVPLLITGALWELGTITSKPEDMPTKYDRYTPGSASVSLMDNDELNVVPGINILYNVHRLV